LIHVAMSRQSSIAEEVSRRKTRVVLCCIRRFEVADLIRIRRLLSPPLFLSSTAGRIRHSRYSRRTDETKTVSSFLTRETLKVGSPVPPFSEICRSTSMGSANRVIDLPPGMTNTITAEPGQKRRRLRTSARSSSRRPLFRASSSSIPLFGTKNRIHGARIDKRRMTTLFDSRENRSALLRSSR